MADVAQVQWVNRVLGVAVTPTPERPHVKLLPIWVGAKDKVDEGLSALQGKMRATQREGFRLIADYGLAGLTDAHGVPMMVALRNLDAAPSSEPARTKAVQAVAGFRKFLLTNKQLLAKLGANTFGIAVPFDAFETALGTIEQHLSH